MSLTPSEDKTSVWKRIRYDPWIIKWFSITGLDDAQASLFIRTQRIISDAEIKSVSRAILIFDVPSQDLAGGAGELYELSCIEVDVLTEISKQPQADMILSQIIALCGKGWSVNGRPVYKVVRTGDLSAAAGFYRCGIRIYYFACIENEIQTI